MVKLATLKRINVVGSACSGKTTASKAICERVGLPHVELDMLYRGPNIEPVPHRAFLERVQSAAGAEFWVLDGDRASVRSLIWDRADAIVWLDYRLATVLTRYFRRTITRRKEPQAIWPETGSKEGWKRMLRRGSLLRLILRTHSRRRRELEAAIAGRKRLEVIRVRSARQLRRWVDTL